MKRLPSSTDSSAEWSSGMSVSEAETLTLNEGINDPSPIDHVIALNWFDGPVSGVLQLGSDGPTFRFSLLDERQQADSTDVRAYGLYPLPANALTSLVELLSPYAAPRWPIGFPIWKF